MSQPNGFLDRFYVNGGMGEPTRAGKTSSPPDVALFACVACRVVSRIRVSPRGYGCLFCNGGVVDISDLLSGISGRRSVDNGGAFSILFKGQDLWQYLDQRGYFTSPQIQPDKVYGAFRSWRMWRIPYARTFLKGEGGLRALVSSYVWEPGENVCHEVPSIDQSPPILKMTINRLGNVIHTPTFGADRSGFYGFTDFSSFEKQEFVRLKRATAGIAGDGFGGLDCTVIGSTLNYGRLVTAEYGIRAEKSIPESLVLSDNPELNKDLEKIAGRYGMNLVSLDDAKAMPTGLRPYGEVSEVLEAAKK